MNWKRLAVLALVLTACNAAPERSVNPGINDSYRDVEDPSKFVARFERYCELGNTVATDNDPRHPDVGELDPDASRGGMRSRRVSKSMRE